VLPVSTASRRGKGGVQLQLQLQLQQVGRLLGCRPMANPIDRSIHRSLADLQLLCVRITPDLMT
jgi:hypothetical protein